MRDPKRTAAAILAISPESEGGGSSSKESKSEDDSGEFDTETAALDAASEELIEAVGAGDPGAVSKALRAAFRSFRR